jgi:hypothetical protein
MKDLSCLSDVEQSVLVASDEYRPSVSNGLEWHAQLDMSKSAGIDRGQAR